ncbi:group III truncated hemoglobin [Enterovirga sp.]|uniref:group III truncated hemoglobin n=1 Tax=Enterovirga sp. TaxID=2026350 RepID=UPI002CFD4160|nr:group III truncated hemoglobin [Enterovirga sp.]HMO29882.1 group III truncated hemoglobin [Enterovirga sp.]
MSVTFVGDPAAPPLVSEAAIRDLVHTFYGRVREDELIGPVFEAEVADWDRHLANLCDFWSSVVLRTSRYQGRPLRPHLRLRLEGAHFDRWLDLFERTAAEVLPREAAPVFIDRARRIADSFEMAVAGQAGQIRAPRHMARAAAADDASRTILEG